MSDPCQSGHACPPGARLLSRLTLVDRLPGWEAPVSQKALTLEGTSACRWLRMLHTYSTAHWSMKNHAVVPCLGIAGQFYQLAQERDLW